MTAFSDGPRRHLRRPKPRPAHGSEDKDSLFGQLTLPNHPGIPQHQRAGFALAALSLVACAVLAHAWQDSAVMRPLPKASSTALAGHFLAPGAKAVPPPRAIIPAASPTLPEASSTALAGLFLAPGAPAIPPPIIPAARPTQRSTQLDAAAAAHVPAAQLPSNPSRSSSTPLPTSPLTCSTRGTAGTPATQPPWRWLPPYAVRGVIGAHGTTTPPRLSRTHAAAIVAHGPAPMAQPSPRDAKSPSAPLLLMRSCSPPSWLSPPRT